MRYECSKFMERLVHPVLKCFVDQDSRVRYYACESMYNIAKVGRNHVLPFFNDLFDGLCKVHRFSRFVLPSILTVCLLVVSSILIFLYFLSFYHLVVSRSRSKR